MTERSQFPGEDLVSEGLKDLNQGITSQAALLVLIGSPRLRRMGISIPFPFDKITSPEHALFSKLQAENSRDAHSRYNSLIRRLVSFERALERHHRWQLPPLIT